MGTKIQLLDEITVNQIAAGEVIENPASVVKELVDNSIDAGAQEITIEITAGGRQLIRVSDDGVGMNREDAKLSLHRHATSKIRSADDLFGVSTMGFRGEAIPSIASISKFTLITSTGAEGTMLMVDGGKVIECLDCMREQGTTIEVKELFYNVPVRKKFQRSPAYDTGEIQKVITNIALANPQVKFTLISHGKRLISANRPKEKGEVEAFGERVEALLGRDFLGSTSPIQINCGEAKLFGYIGLPSAHRPNRTGQYLFVNRRAVQALGISYAIKDGYGSALPTNRHPIFVIQATIPGDLVDVNVHPQKREVRLRQEMALREAISGGVSEAIGKVDISEKTAVFERVEKNSFGTFRGSKSFDFNRKSPSFSSYTPPSSSKGAFSSAPQLEKEPALMEQKELEIGAKKRVKAKVMGSIPPYLIVDPATVPEGNELGALSGLVCIDQRAAHKRVLFERLQSENEGERKSQSTPLLIPIKSTIPADQWDQLIDSKELIQKLGWEVRLDKKKSVAILEALPAYVRVSDGERLFKELIFDLDSNGGRIEIEDGNDSIRLIRLAAKSAVKAGERLSTEEAEGLIEQLFECKSPYYCPQGKPTMVAIGQEEIANKFS